MENLFLKMWPLAHFSDEKFCLHDLKYRKCEGNSKELIVMGQCTDNEDSDVVYCIEKTELDGFLNDDEETQKLGKWREWYSAYKPTELYELVLGKVETSVGFVWCRCLFLKSLGSKVEMFCIDYGIVCFVDIEHIRVISKLTILLFSNFVKFIHIFNYNL